MSDSVRNSFNKPAGKGFSKALSFGLLLLFAMLHGCDSSGGGYNSGYATPPGYYDWYHYGGYSYDGVYVPAYPDYNPDNLPDRGDRPRPEHPIVKPDQPMARPTPTLPTRARPTSRSSFSGGGFSRGGMRGGGMRGGRGGRR
jgi:hypothetical protein